MSCGVARGCHLANSMVNPLVNSFGMQIFKDLAKTCLLT